MENKQKITVVAIGAGHRMNSYTEYALLHPEEMEVVAVVEPNKMRREYYKHRFHLTAASCYVSWESFLEEPQKADAVFLCTPDHLHYAPAMKALEKGYDLLLEKPIAQSWQECLDIALFAKRMNRVVGVGHVLRYHPYFTKLKEIVEQGDLGTMISINHVEAVGVDRMTHAFVRGLWCNEEETNPMILSKACHDLDLLVWLTGRKCVQVSSYGSLKWFCKENAPEGSSYRCIDGCTIETECPYSAVDLYYRRRRWLRHFDFQETGQEDEQILHELHHGQYGRCVYHCDNNVVDHQVVAALMEDDITISFSMDIFTKNPGRRTHIMFSSGEILGDEETLTIRYFNQRKTDEQFDFRWSIGENNFHGGADLNIVADFVAAVRNRDSESLLANIESSLESHRMAFEIERQRKGNRD